MTIRVLVSASVSDTSREFELHFPYTGIRVDGLYMEVLGWLSGMDFVFTTSGDAACEKLKNSFTGTPMAELLSLAESQALTNYEQDHIPEKIKPDEAPGSTTIEGELSFDFTRSVFWFFIESSGRKVKVTATMTV